jgi:hypothetical protein
MSKENDDDKLARDILAGSAEHLAKLLYEMMESGKRRGTLVVRPAFNGIKADYSLWFDVRATTVPDGLKQSIKSPEPRRQRRR